MEDGIVNYQADYIDEDHSDYIHNNVARIAITNVLGDEFSAGSSNTRKDFYYETDVPDNYVKDNLRILVIVQKSFGTQTVLSDGGYGEYYVDNCTSVKVGERKEPDLK